ncbi:MAG TPA: hypothetical protein VM368_08690 [Flavisolibacter sp.]|nr:hypothetical protein [Flavisolibacter sp.]
MRKIFLLLLALPVLALAQDKNVLTITRVFPKADKVKQLEKAFGAHAQKYHKGDVIWRVSTIETGPDAGGYSIVEGPTTWDNLDKRGDLGKAHTDDWDLNIQPLLTDKTFNAYVTFRQDLSTTLLTDYSDKYAVTHYFYKPGYRTEMEQLIAGLKKAWTDSEQYVAVYETSSSGEPQFIIVTRYKKGLKEREVGYRLPMAATYAKVNGGENAWEQYRNGLKQAVERQWSEMLVFKPELSSK